MGKSTVLCALLDRVNYQDKSPVKTHVYNLLVRRVYVGNGYLLPLHVQMPFYDCSDVLI